jgi:hypothetical protein
MSILAKADPGSGDYAKAKESLINLEKALAEHKKKRRYAN